MAKVLFLVAALSCLLYIACAKTYIDKAIALSSSTEGVSTLADREATGAGCNCSSILCQCCINVDIPIPPIHESLCAKLVWLQKAFGVAIRVDAGSNNMLFEMIYNTTYPAKCLNVPIVGDGCFKMSNYTFVSNGACGLFELTFTVITKDFHFPFGVFHFGDTSRLPCPKESFAFNAFEKDYSLNLKAIQKLLEAEKMKQLGN